MNKKFNVTDFITDQNHLEEKEISTQKLTKEAVELWELVVKSNQSEMKEVFEIYANDVNFRSFYRTVHNEKKEAFCILLSSLWKKREIKS